MQQRRPVEIVRMNTVRSSDVSPPNGVLNFSSNDSGFFPTCPSPQGTSPLMPSTGYCNGFHHPQSNSSQVMMEKVTTPSSDVYDAYNSNGNHSNSPAHHPAGGGNSPKLMHKSNNASGGYSMSAANEPEPHLNSNYTNDTFLNKRVKLNVGGKVFETLLSTLQKAGEDSNLATVAKEAAAKDLPMFIDRDSDTFSILLNYLRTGQLLVPSWADFSTVQLLKLDSNFYGIHNSAYLNALEQYNILKKFNFSINVTFFVPDLIVNEIKNASEGQKRKEAESKWLNWYKEDMLSFGKVFKASSISSFNAHFIAPHWGSLKVCFVLWSTNCNKENITLFMKDLSKLHFIEELEIVEL